MAFEELLKLVSTDKSLRICTDSRLVRPGDIFIAIKGTVCDGHDFINNAIAAGARYVVAQKCEPSHEPRATSHEIIIVSDSAQAAAILAQAQYDNPASKLTNLAVTGTNGKSTVAFLVRSVLQNAGRKCGLIGTLVYDTGSQSSEAVLTTPDGLVIAEKQQQMVEAGLEYMVTEASSHALSQNRLAGINFKAAAFTNLTGDHLDYHRTEDSYLSAKSLLFEKLSSSATAVLNKQSPHSKEIAKKTKADILWYAIDEPSDITAHIESMDTNGTVFVIRYRGSRATSHESRVTTPLLGRFNVSNHLAAAGLCLAAGLDLETVAKGLSSLRCVPGRLENVNFTSHGTLATGHVLIDYAHTDDALKNVLSTLRPVCKGKLTVVFGCGGDRDRTKRARMARVAEDLADFVIVTSDNPRTEPPEQIIGEIVTGFEKPTADTISIEVDRRKAIELAIEQAQKDDIVLIAGKGHETYQIIGNKKINFSDKAVALECLDKIR